MSRHPRPADWELPTEERSAAEIGALRENPAMARPAPAPRPDSQEPYASEAAGWQVPDFEDVHARTSPGRIARREAAARLRARRLLLLDSAAGALLALFAILIAPGLAIVAVFAIPLLAGCLYSLVSERTGWKLRPALRRLVRRGRRGRAPRRRPGPR